MFFVEPHFTRLAAGAETIHSSAQIPMVYERIPDEPVLWEYHVLSVDPREGGLPVTEQLNALGRDGWIMSGLLDERTSGSGHSVVYYFVRRLQS